MANKERVLTIEDLGIVAHGSDAHAALLGINSPGITPQRKADLQAALDAGPPPVVSIRLPITRKNYKPKTRRSEGDNILDGWRRLQR